METMDPNMTAIAVMAIVSMLLGWIWYSPSLFGNTMCCSSSKTECKSCSWGCYLGGFLTFCVMGYVLSHFMIAMQANTSLSGAMVGFWAWLGFIATTMFSKVLWKHKSMTKFMVCSGYNLVVLLLMGAVLAVWH